MNAAQPPGACDCHTHVVGDPRRFPMVADRRYTPGPASAVQLQDHLLGLGLERVVIVQPSIYGTDNRCLLESLAFFEGRARGVAVVDEDIDMPDLQALHAAGVRGLRINQESSGTTDAQGLVASLRRWAGRLKGLPWHLQVFASLDTVAQAAPHLPALGLPVVLDHFAMVSPGTPAADPRLQALLDLLRTGAAYLKLSAPYRIGGDAAGVARLARLFIETRPDRMLWASDWPHTDREAGKGPLDVSAYRAVPVAGLAAQLADWAPDDTSRRQLLVENPARLYGFDS
jgi:predicted TIM-barrel fold metal-dependent hydrolase